MEIAVRSVEAEAGLITNQDVFLCREEGLGGLKATAQVGIGEALRIDKPYKSKVVLCWEGGSKSAGGGVMKGGPLKDLEVLVMGNDARREERPGAGKQYCD